MRDIYTFLSFILSLMPFAFYELEGPFGVLPDSKSTTGFKSQRASSSEINFDQYKSFYMYSPYLRCSVNFDISPSTNVNKEVIDFFNGNNCLKATDLYIIKGKPGLTFEGYQKQREHKELIKVERQESWWNPFKRLRNKTTIQTLTPIKIDKTYNEISIGHTDYYQKLQDVLKNYFYVGGKKYIEDEEYENKNIRHISEIVCRSYYEDNKEKLLPVNVYTIKNIATHLDEGIFVNQLEQDLLNKSNILDLYGVIENEEEEYIFMWGLAEYIKTKRKFHWMTILKIDSAELLKDIRQLSKIKIEQLNEYNIIDLNNVTLDLEQIRHLML